MTPAGEPIAEACDHLGAERLAPLDRASLILLDLTEPGADARAARLGSTQAVVIGVDRTGVLPDVDGRAFDGLLTVAVNPPAPWAAVQPSGLAARLARIEAVARAAPIATSLLARVLRMGESLPLHHALTLESLAYSTLLGGAEFAAWRGCRRAAPPAARSDGFVTAARDDDLWTIRLTRADTRNAMSAGMRDALFEALAMVLDDPSRPGLRLEAEGPCFSVGGDLAEFGTATDLARAHVIRITRSCAALLAELGPRAEVLLHGACIGSGFEVPMAAGRRVARSNAFFQLPELTMGLIPGAGGTATVTRIIGRHRTCLMVLSGQRLPAATALAWGLVDRIEPAP